MIVEIGYMSWVWLGVLVLCLVIEGVTMSLTTIWAAIASLPLIFIARAPLPLKWQLLIFAVLTLVLVIFTRPFAVKKLKKSVKTNVDSLEGREAPVVATVTTAEKGVVRLSNGTEWQALSSEGTIQAGERCLIERVEGNTLIVKPKSQQEVPAEKAVVEGDK